MTGVRPPVPYPGLGCAVRESHEHDDVVPSAGAQGNPMPMASGVDFREAVEAAIDGRRRAGPVAVDPSVQLMQETAECGCRCGSTGGASRCGLS